MLFHSARYASILNLIFYFLQKAFAAKALEVAMSTPTVKREPMRQCMRCDKETPAKDMKCAHCGFQATLSGMFSF